MDKKKVLLISVGGAPAPVIFSIKENNPDIIIFFVSKTSRNLVSENIIPELIKSGNKIPDHEFVVTANEQDLGECVKDLLLNVPLALSKLDADFVSWPQIADYTAGTKTMSAAVAWASSGFPCSLSYIGTGSSEGRTKNGLGIVIDGRERAFLIENPWNKIAYFETRKAIHLFNNVQYGNAYDLIKNVIDKVDDNKTKNILKLFRNLFKAYYYWDIFNHYEAMKIMKVLLPKIEAYSGFDHYLSPLLVSLKEKLSDNFNFLMHINPNQLSWSIIHDLIANAKRRALIEQKYEDAVARVYAAIEKIAKYELMKTYGIDNSNANLELIPDNLKSEYLKKYTNKIYTENNICKEVIQFGVTASYKILAAKNNRYGRRFESIKNITGHLSKRNSSILGHGMLPCSKNDFNTIFADVLFILDLKEPQLPEFPNILI